MVNITGSNIKGFQFAGGAHTVDNYTNSNTISVTEIPRVYLYDVKSVITSDEDSYDLNKIAQSVLYPNPTTGKLTIKYDVKKINVLSTEGEILKEFGSQSVNSELDIAELPAGVYIFQITTEKGDLVNKKIVKM